MQTLLESHFTLNSTKKQPWSPRHPLKAPFWCCTNKFKFRLRHFFPSSSRFLKRISTPPHTHISKTFGGSSFGRILLHGYFSKSLFKRIELTLKNTTLDCSTCPISNIGQLLSASFFLISTFFLCEGLAFYRHCSSEWARECELQWACVRGVGREGSEHMLGVGVWVQSRLN